jgi:multicomponent Na+:H+ antiporter subunit F
MIDVIVFSLVGVGLLFAVLRLLIGPTTADRVVSLDTLNVIVIGVIALLANQFNNSLYLDIAIVYGILAFIETVVFARYLEGKNNDC